MIDEKKKQIRKEIRRLKSHVALEEKKARSAKILEKVEAILDFQEAKTIMLYWSMEDEVHTHEFVCKWAQKKRIILPCVDGDQLLLKEFKGLDTLVDGDLFGIPEPDGPVFEKPEEIDLILVPGVAFDTKKNRMGRGKAYYDRLLKSVDAFKLGICFDFQLLDEVPVDEHDVKMNLIISE
ncbi:MAG: 5-formyltetrahydrofolate cyclo-ligase [Marinifilaceae bacterium]